MSKILSIDPGSKAAVALTGHVPGKPPTLIWVHELDLWENKMFYLEDLYHLTRHIKKGDVDLIMTERVRSRPGQGVASTFKFGASFGIALGFICGALGTPNFIEVEPSTWKRSMGVTSDKKTSLRMAQKIFGENLFTRVKDHNKAEASLIGAFAGGYRP